MEHENIEETDSTEEEIPSICPNTNRSLLGALEDGGMLEADIADYEWCKYQALSLKAKCYLRMMVNTPLMLNRDPKIRDDHCHHQFGMFNDRHTDAQRAEFMSLLMDGFVHCDEEDKFEVFGISARGLRVLQMESGGDLFGEAKQAELQALFSEWDISARITALAYRFMSFYSNDVTPDAIRAFLGQFEVPSDARRMLKILEEIRFYSKREVTRILRHYLALATNDLNDNFVIVLFGNLADSTAEMTQTVMKEVFKDATGLARIRTLSEALADSSNPTIIFFDDIIASGTQSVQMFREMIGTWEHEREHYAESLSKAEIKALQERKLCLVCCHGTRKGIAKLETFINENALQLEICCEQLASIDIFSDDFIPYLWSNADNRDYWQGYFEKLGFELLDDGRSDSLRWRDALGWKGGRGLTVYAHNVPTTTLTFLWRGVSCQNGIWKPLFPRREK